MENQIKALPAIIRMRAERILKAGAKTAYRLDASDANLIKVVMLDDQVRYVNLREGREVKSTELKVIVVNDDQQTEPEKKERKPRTVKAITRDDVEGKKTASNKPKSRSVTKKKGAKK